MDPHGLLQLAEEVERQSRRLGRKCRVLLLVISKSGTTIEPSSALKALRTILAPFADLSLLAITDKEKGTLRHYANEHHLPCFTVPDGIGGRFSELSQVGLVFARLIGVDIEALLSGARMVEEACQSEGQRKTQPFCWHPEIRSQQEIRHCRRNHHALRRHPPFLRLVVRPASGRITGKEI